MLDTSRACRLLSWPCAAWLCLATTGGLANDPVAVRNANETREQLDAQIAKLIEQLGDTQYHAREKAQEELHRIGIAAFDALLAAQDHGDIEIAMRARYLVRSMPIAWSKDSDARELKQFFKDYSSRDREERATRAQQFSKLDDPEGTAALCRIVRFDVDRVLSKEAAVLGLNRPWPETPEARQRRAEAIRQEVANSKRAGAE